VLDDGRFGRLADDESFAETVVELLGDAEARQRLTARGLERAQVYALERMVDAYERLLLDLTRSRLD
jgi:glycosyltransferase involved in cell wall biosynthesis